MAHEIAKLLLEHAGTFLERSEAIRTAMSMGMPLDEIERFLDWLDASRGPVKQDQNEPPKGDPKSLPKKG
jgi:DNA-binding transcriptional MerR regulator